MGTRALIHIKSGNLNSKTLVTIYRQYDGYPAGLAVDIWKALNRGDFKITNGYAYGDEIPSTFNGMGCLAAYLIGALKDNKIGNVYIMEPDIYDVGEEFAYTVYIKDGVVKLQIGEILEFNLQNNDDFENAMKAAQSSAGY